MRFRMTADGRRVQKRRRRRPRVRRRRRSIVVTNGDGQSATAKNGYTTAARRERAVRRRGWHVGRRRARANILSPAAGSPLATGASTPYCIVENAAGTRLYVAGMNVNGIGEVSVSTLDAMGTISGRQPGTPLTTNVHATPTRMAMNPSGTRLYVAHQGIAGNRTAVFQVDATGNLGSLQSGSPSSRPISGT